MSVKKISFEEDKKAGKVTMDKNGHVANFNDDDYERLLKGYRCENCGTCYLCGKKILHTMDKNIFSTKPKHINRFSWEFPEYGTNLVVDKSPCSMAEHKKQEGAYKISIPTGELIIGNYFLDKDGEYAFDVPEKEKYGEKYNICNIQGQNNRAEYVAEKFNVGYVQINSGVGVWISKDRSKIIFVMEPSDWEEFDKEDKKFNKDFKKTYKKIGELDQRVWRYEFADKSIIKNCNAEVSPDYKPITIEVPKGRYIIKHHYGKMYFRLNHKRYVIVTEIELRSSTREILTEKINEKSGYKSN